MDKQKKKRKSITSMTVIYLIIAAVVSAALIMSSYCMIQYRNVSRESADLLNRFEETYKFMKGKESDTSDEVQNDFSVSARLTASAIRTSSDTLEPGRYGKGWIVRKRGESVELPEDYDSDITLAGADLPEDYSTNVVGDTEVSCARIQGAYYYVEFEPASEEKAVIESGVNYQKALDNLADAAGYDYLSLVSDKNGDYSITTATRQYSDFSKSSELGLNRFLSTVNDTGSDAETPEEIVSKVIHIKGRSYIAFATESFDINYVPDDAAVMLVPLNVIILRALAFTIVLLFLILIMCIPLAIWLISIFRRFTCGYFTDEQLSNYSFEVIKRKVGIFVVACTLIAYCGAAFTMSLDSVFLQTSRGNSTLREFFNRVDDDKERTDIQWESSQARYIENAKRLAALIDSNRELQKEKWLEEASEIIKADYIMIFDEKGDELISNSRYKHISLLNRENPEMADFSRLLNGVESISHADVDDEVTGLTRDYHGICLRDFSDSDSYGALLIAVDPEEHNWVRFNNISDAASVMAPENGFIIGIDPETGAADVASSKKLAGTKLKKSDRDDSYLGFIKVSRKPYFAVSSAHGDKYYYYGIGEKEMMYDGLKFAALYALMCLLIIKMLCHNLLKRSPYKTDDAVIINEFTKKKLDRLSAFIQKAAEKNSRLLRVNDDRLSVERSKDQFYRNVTPIREALSAFEMLLFIFTLSIGTVVLVRNMSSSGDQTVIDYLLAGKWTHGLNIFSISAILLHLCILFLFLAFLKAMSALLDPVLSKRGRTISSLIMNILFYAAVIAFIFFALGYLGVNARALLASAGFVGLAVSMSFKDIISDILAGIMIITGRTFEVGDYIEIRDASAGTVTKMGLRKTELVSNNDKTFSIRNSHISKVTNHSRMDDKARQENAAPKGKKAGKENKSPKEDKSGKESAD